MNSEYFQDEELECHCGRHNPNNTANVINPILLERLDRLRELWGKPINVSCAVRCREHNREVGGVDNSQHVLGNAADVYIGSQTERNSKEYHIFYGFILGTELFDGVGYYPDSEFVHVDVRNNGHTPNAFTWQGD